MEGTLGKPKGSMINAPELVDGIKRQRDLDLLQKSQEKVDREKQEQKEDVRQKEIDKMLPEKVRSVYGELPYEEFKAAYKDVWEAVKSKDHYAHGFVTHSGKLSDGTPISVRTLRKHEADAVRSLVPKTAVFQGATMESFQAESSRYETVRIVASVLQFGENTFTEPMKLTLKDMGKWEGHTEIVARMEWVNSLPDEVVAVVSAIIDDTMRAYQYALTENLKNQLPPL